MTDLNEEWAFYIKRKAKFGKRLSIGGVFLLLLSICMILFRKYDPSLLYYFPLFLLSGLILLIAGGNVQVNATIPTDVFGVPANVSANHGTQGEIIKFKPFFSARGIMRITGILALCLGLLICLAKSGHLPGNLEAAFIFLLVMSIMSLLILLVVLILIVVNTKDHTMIVINGSDKSISFINLFTKKTKTYLFDELDGFVSVYYITLGRSGPRKVPIIYLVKQRKRIEKISIQVYPKSAALQSGLGLLKQLKFTDTLPLKL